MTFQVFLEEFRKLKLEEERTRTAEYLEIVISRNILGPLNEVLASRFGAPLKPEGDMPSGEANRRAKPFGGVRKNQTMYFRQNDGFCEYAFLWPWEGGVRITAKIIQAPDDPSPAKSWKDLFAGLLSRKS